MRVGAAVPVAVLELLRDTKGGYPDGVADGVGVGVGDRDGDVDGDRPGNSASTLTTPAHAIASRRSRDRAGPPGVGCMAITQKVARQLLGR